MLRPSNCRPAECRAFALVTSTLGRPYDPSARPHDRGGADSGMMVPSRGLAQPALVCAAHGAVGAADLQVAGDPLQRHSDHDPPARGPRAYRAGTPLCQFLQNRHAIEKSAEPNILVTACPSASSSPAKSSLVGLPQNFSRHGFGWCSPTDMGGQHFK